MPSSDSFLRRAVAIDLGTANVRAFSHKGLVLNENSSVLVDKLSGKRKIGKDSLRRSVRSNSLTLDPAIVRGTVADYDSTVHLIRHAIAVSAGRFHVYRPSLMLAIADDASSSEKLALIDAARQAGALSVKLIPSTTAAALGAGLDIDDYQARGVIDIGAGSIKMGIFSSGEVFVSQVEHFGINDLILRIVRQIRQTYRAQVSIQELEEKLIKQLSATKGLINEFELTAQSMDGLAKKVLIDRTLIDQSIDIFVKNITKLIKRTLENATPEIVSDLTNTGLVLTGGGANFADLDNFLQNEVGIKVVVADRPDKAVIRGATKALRMRRHATKELAQTVADPLV